MRTFAALFLYVEFSNQLQAPAKPAGYPEFSLKLKLYTVALESF